MARDDEQQPDAAPPEPTADRRVRGYRTPRYPVFLVTGAVLGLLVGVGIAVLGGSSAEQGSATPAGVLGYFSAFGALFGALLAGALAVVVESVLNRGRRGRARPGPRRPRGGTRPR